MKRLISFLMMLVLALTLVSSPTVASVGDSLYISKYNGTTSQWTNITLTDNSISISSDITLLDGLVINNFDISWAEIDILATQENFYGSDSSDENPTTIIELNYNGKSGRQEYGSLVDPIPDGLFAYSSALFARITGLIGSYRLWPISIQVSILEIHPEQYDVSTTIVRGNDMLSVIKEDMVTLLVTDYDIHLQYFSPHNGSILHKESKLFSIASGGNSINVKFSTFSVGVDFSPQNLYYYIFLSEGVYLQLDSTGSQMKLGESELHVSEITPHTYVPPKNDDQSEALLDVPFSTLFAILAPLSVIIIRKKRSIG